MSRDPDEAGRPAIDEPGGDETVVAGPRARRKPKFVESSSGLKTAIYSGEHSERPPTVPEGTDEIAIDQPDVTDTFVQTGITHDPSQRARVLEVHHKADQLLAELDATANIKIPRVDPEARTEPAALDDEPEPIAGDDDDDSIEEGETIVDPRAREKLHYPAPLAAATPAPGTIPGTGAVVAHTPLPGAVAIDDDDLMTIETGWSPPAPGLSPVAPRPIPPPPRRSVGSVLLAPFRAIASLFRSSPSAPGGADLDESHNLQTYTQVNRMVQRRRPHPTSSPPPGGRDGDQS